MFFGFILRLFLYLDLPGGPAVGGRHGGGGGGSLMFLDLSCGYFCTWICRAVRRRRYFVRHGGGEEERLGTAEAERRTWYGGSPCTYISDLGVDCMLEDNIIT